MIHQMTAEPSAADRPEEPLRPSGGRGAVAPEIRIVMEAPAGKMIQFPCRILSLLGEIPDELEKRSSAFGKIGVFRRPVVHLGIDVGRVVAAPGREEKRIPDALKICRLRPRTGGGDHQISSIVVEQRRKRGRKDLPVLFQSKTLRNGSLISRLFRKFQNGFPRKSLVVFDMPALQRVESGFFRILQIRRGEGLPVDSALFRHGAPVFEIGADGKDQRDRIGSLDFLDSVFRKDGAAFCHCFQVHAVTDSGMTLFIFPDDLIPAVVNGTFAVEDDVLAERSRLSMNLRCKFRFHVYGSRCSRSDPVDNRLCGGGGKRLPPEGDPSCGVLHGEKCG